MRTVFAIACALAACGAVARTASGAATVDPAAPSGRCALQIVLVLADAKPVRPAASVVRSLARAANVQLAFVRDAGTASFVYRLTAPGTVERCQRGLQRLRADPRVRAADVDSRRQANGMH